MTTIQKHIAIADRSLQFLLNKNALKNGGMYAAIRTIEAMEKLTRNKRKLSSACVAMLLSLTVLFTGCGTLREDGPYRGDQVAYHADLSITTSYEVIHSFVKWEYDNRELLSRRPEIRESADSMRRHAPGWIKSAIALRETYSAEPTRENRDKLQIALDLLNSAVQEAYKHLNERK